MSLALPPDSGLVLIETARERIVNVAPVHESEVPTARRRRVPRVEIAEEPLQLVETRKEPPPAN